MPRQGEGTAASIEAEFRAAHAQVVERLARARGLHLARAKVKSPFMPLVSYSLGHAFAIIAAHGRRHLWQGERVRANPAFPRG